MLTPKSLPLQIVKSSKLPFDSDDGLFEIKHDGFRVMAVRQGRSSKLFTRNGYDISRGHPHITRKLDALRFCASSWTVSSSCSMKTVDRIFPN